MEKAYTFDDISIIPRYSTIESRSECDLSTRFTKNFNLRIPIVAAPMSSICEYDMAYELMRLGGVGIVHRFNTILHQTSITSRLKHESKNLVLGNVPIAAAIGATDDYFERAGELLKCGTNVILIDVAHGQHKNVQAAIEKLQELKSRYTFDIIAGNVASQFGAEDLECWGADAIRVGVSNGGACTTRLNTGVGVPQATAIAWASETTKIPIIADGGIRYPGDAAKALALGADTVMLGSMLAATEEAPGEWLTVYTGEVTVKKVKKFYGSASAMQKELSGKQISHVEGEYTLIDNRGSVSKIISNITDGIKSSMSYVGARNLMEFRVDAEFIQVTHAGMLEGHPHGVKK